MKNLSGWKLWVFLGVSVVLAAGVFLLQSGPVPEPEPTVVGEEGVPTDEFTRQFVGPNEPEAGGAGDALAPESEGEGGGGDGLVDVPPETLEEGKEVLTGSGVEVVDPGFDGPVEAAREDGAGTPVEPSVEGAGREDELPVELVPGRGEGTSLEPGAEVVGPEVERAAESSSKPGGELPSEGMAGVGDPFLDEVSERSPVVVEKSRPETLVGVVDLDPDAAVVVVPVEVVEGVEGTVEKGDGLPVPVENRRLGGGRRIEFEASEIRDLEAALDAELEAARLEEAESVVAVEGDVVEVVAGQAPAEELGGNLALRLVVPQARRGDRVLRDSLGYRVPLVVRQEVPDQIKGGVYVPAHETYVIARAGHWAVDGEVMPGSVVPVEAGDGAIVEEGPPRALLPWLLWKLRRPKGDGGTE